MKGTRSHKLFNIRLLAVLSPVLLLLFLIRWLDSQYNAEKAELTKELTREYYSSGNEVSDKAMYAQFIAPILDSNKIDIGGKPQVHIEIMDTGMGVQMIKQERFIDVNTTETGKRKDTRVTTQVNTIRLKNDKEADSFLSRGVRLLLARAGTASQLPFQINDTSLQNNFKRKLAAAHYPFRLDWIKPGDAQNRADGIYVGGETGLPGMSGVMITRYSGYLLKKLLPEILFAFFLLAITTTALITIYRSLRSQQKLSLMKNDLISNMTHELKTPIATVKVALEVLENFEVKDPAATKEFLRMAVLEMDRLELLVNQALNTSLLESGEMKIIPAREDIALLTERIIQALQPRLEQHKAKLSIRKEGNDFMADVDKLHYQGLIINLVDNSLKYAGKEPVISIVIKEEASTVVISITDNGPGIPTQYLGRVFDKFFRVPSGNIHNTHGYGLGLSYARKIAERHGGTLSVQNNTGGGCSFSVTISKAQS